ncbi:MAG: hypothetical protein EHM18_16595, partial [Acidobacteria bacterium]
MSLRSCETSSPRTTRVNEPSFSRPDWQRRVLFLVSVFLAVLIIYAPALYLPFQFDDALFLRDDNVRLGRLEAFLVPPAPRLLAWLTFVLQNQWHGFSPAHFHAFNVVVHAL